MKSDTKYPIAVFLGLFFVVILFFISLLGGSTDKEPKVSLVHIFSTPTYETDTFRMEYYPALEIGNKSKDGRFYLVSFKEKQMHSGAKLDQVRGFNVMLASSVNIDPAAAKAYTVMHFEPGQYVIDDIKTKYYRQLNDFATKVLNNIGHCDYDLYVRGMADKPNFIGYQRAEYFYDAINYFPRLGGYRYRDVLALPPYQVGKQYTNKDLPFLRGAFLQQIYYEAYEKYVPVKAIILEGEVTDNENILDRKAELFLYLDKRCAEKNQ